VISGNFGLGPTGPGSIFLFCGRGKRVVDLSGIKTNVDSHYLDEAVLKGWHQLEDEVYKELKRISASFCIYSKICECSYWIIDSNPQNL